MSETISELKPGVTLEEERTLFRFYCPDATSVECIIFDSYREKDEEGTPGRWKRVKRVSGIVRYLKIWRESGMGTAPPFLMAIPPKIPLTTGLFLLTPTAGMSLSEIVTSRTPEAIFSGKSLIGKGSGTAFRMIQET